MVRKCQTVISCSVRYVGVVNINSGGGGIHNTIEMQRYIDISPYRDTLGSDTVSIHI